jgi:hypothetical protein
MAENWLIGISKSRWKANSARRTCCVEPWIEQLSSHGLCQTSIANSVHVSFSSII